MPLYNPPADIVEIAATFAALPATKEEKFYEVTADENNNNDMSLYVYDGTILRFLQTIAP